MKRNPLFALLLVLFLIPFASQAQVTETVSSPVVTLNHIALNVVDLKASKTFYEEIVGLELMEEPFHDGLHEWFKIGPYSQLHLIKRATEAIDHDKNTHLCFSVPSVDEFITRLDENQLDFTNWAGDGRTPTIRVDGVKQIYLQDPDGYWIEINDDMPFKKQ